MKEQLNVINTLIKAMSLEEKASLFSGRDEWTSKALERLGIPSLWFSDGPHGLRRSPLSTTGGYGDQLPATCYPTASAIAATWNTALVEELGRHLGVECQAQGVDVLLGPGVNIKRSPLGGRNFEYFSEDPLLAGELGAAYIRGVQSQGVGTSLKHFAANSQETRRMLVSSNVDQRALRELYLTNFEIAIKKAQPWTVMAAYNPVNGVDATANPHLLHDILRDEWKFEGMVISDWQAVYELADCVAAGLNLEMPGNGGYNDAAIVHAVRSGQLSEARVDQLLEHYLKVVLRANTARNKGLSFSVEAHHLFARQVAGESIVLLKNDRKLLPIDSKRHQKVALIGDFATKPRVQGNGSSEVKPTKLETLLEELSAHAQSSFQLSFAQGYSCADDHDVSHLSEAVALAGSSDVVVLFVGLPSHFESEGVDRTHLDLPVAQVALIEAVAQVHRNVVVVLTNGAAVSMPWVNGVSSIVEAWLGGQAGAGAIADVLVGKVNPSGKLAETFPVRLEDTAAFLDLPSPDLNLRYSEGIYVGYRWFEKRKIQPLFAFGHGLSYSEFKYSDLTLSTTHREGGPTWSLRCQVTNVSDRPGKEVVQLYVHDVQSRLPRPFKELKGFEKVSLAPGETVAVTFSLGRRDLSYYDDSLGTWVAESGQFEFLVGSSSADIRLRQKFDYVSDQFVFHGFTERTCLRDWLRYPELRALALAAVKPFFDQAPGLVQGPYEDFNISNTFFIDMPLIKYARLSGGRITEDSLRAVVEQARTIAVRV